MIIHQQFTFLTIILALLTPILALLTSILVLLILREETPMPPPVSLDQTLYCGADQIQKRSP